MRMHNSRNGISPKHTLAQSQIEHEYTSDYGLFQKKKRSREGGGIYIVQGYRKKPEKLTCTLGEFNMSRGKLCVQGGQFDA